ncbi:hypothetical protein RvY_02203 [Ramazzottius varieornatus]|uniref:Uncharacterized protein n=1 Tax=Ramazzottius varieornatus TaxID=947166 RepID=A0A1D1UIX6_RAMVA|nr:hypothetical protein RvY_02203 [Ramazzottius varieornatus]
MPKIRDAEQAAYMIHALSCLAKVVSKDKLHELADKLLGTVITIARRHPQESSASEGLAIVLENAASNAKSTLEPQLDQLTDVIFAQACRPPD